MMAQPAHVGPCREKRYLSRARPIANIAVNPTSPRIREMSFFAVRQNEARKEHVYGKLRSEGRNRHEQEERNMLRGLDCLL